MQESGSSRRRKRRIDLMKHMDRKNHFIWLTVALVGMMITGAITTEFPENFAFQTLEYSSIALLLLSLLGLRRDRPWRIALMILIGLMALATFTRNLTDFQNFKYIYMLLLLVFFVSAAWLVGRRVLLTGHVDINVITGSVALYLILGFIWAVLYTMTLQLSPEAIKGLEPEHWISTLSTMTYFSFVTLTTLGYGDMSPSTPIAEVLVVLEAVTGMFYFAVVVASLISAARK
jgi:voltage-gated potassium channel